MGFPGGVVVKNPPANARDAGDVCSISGSRKIPWRRKWEPIPVFLPGKSHGRKSLVGYSPWGLKESDTTEQLHFKGSSGWRAEMSHPGLWKNWHRSSEG